MFYLSDKELDRLSREAASQHDPGDQLMGPGAWERLEARLDKELGGTSTPSPNPLRGIRRLPFQYAPVILLIVGVSYYAVRQFTKPKKAEGSGSPPLTVVKSDQPQAGQTSTDPLTKTPANRENSTPTTEKNTTAQYPGSSDQAGSTNPGQPGQPGGTGNTDGKGSSDAAPGSNSPSTHADGVAPGSTNAPTGAVSDRTAGASTHTPNAPLRPAGSNAGPAGSNSRPGGTSAAPTDAAARPGNAASGPASPSSLAAGTNLRPSGAGSRTTGSGSAYRPGARNGKTGINTGNSHPEYTTSATAGTRTGTHRGGHNRSGDRHVPSNLKNPDGTRDPVSTDHPIDAADPDRTGAAPGNDKSDKAGLALRPEPGAVPIRGPRSLTDHPRISDSALRAYTPPPAPSPTPTRSLHINRSLQFGLQLAPDFASVNSLAGDKPGSSIGITVDYQFINKLYLSTGLLFSKKNYAARIQDCHVPNDYFRMNGLHDVDFIKGSMNMLELPLNLRYDFSVTGNTMFFASVGASSYLLLNQHSDYYYNSFGRPAHRRFDYSNKNAYLLSAVNLSMGVEAGISNSLSLLVAPYVKVPTRSIGFGEIKMNSVGINFALKFAPVISRKRK